MVCLVCNAMGGMTSHHQPPLPFDQVLDGQRPSFAADVYALGIVMFEVFTLQEPFGELTPVQVISRVLINKQRPPLPDMGDALMQQPGAAQFVALMQRCWHMEPQQRPSMEEVEQEMRCVAIVPCHCHVVSSSLGIIVIIITCCCCIHTKHHRVDEWCCLCVLVMSAVH